MPRYKVNRRYGTWKDGIHYGPWAVGIEVELSEQDAAWFNRDSEGVLSLVEPAPQPEPEPEEPAVVETPEEAPAEDADRTRKTHRDRMHRGGQNR